MDALGLTGEEGRSRLRKAKGSRQTGVDPWVSEWGNPMHRSMHYPTMSEVVVRERTQGTETSKYL